MLLHLALEAWQIQDGLYDDFRPGAEASFALEARPRALRAASEPAADALPLRRIGNSFYAVHARRAAAAPAGCWILELPVPAFCLMPPPAGSRPGGWVEGEVQLALDSGAWCEHLRHGADAPLLVRRWRIERVYTDTRFWRAERREETRPISPGARLDNPVELLARLGPGHGFVAVNSTDAWNADQGMAHYILACRDLDGAPRGPQRSSTARSPDSSM